jgi:hypothetical protein
MHGQASAASGSDTPPLDLKQVMLRSTRIHLDDAVRRAELSADEAKAIFDRVHAHIDEIVDGSLAGRRRPLRLVGR